ncbi:MAG: NAD(P)H-hydrate dehydratase, partial [Bacteroidetes bacterium]|nr:NAD(P)H-hydrate dehydratase [Bacteroidota bacterium]
VPAQKQEEAVFHDSINDLSDVNSGDVIIDAIFGTGIKGEITGLAADAIKLINDCRCEKIAIDVPSGLFADSKNQHAKAIVRANHTLTFQFPKLSYLFPESFPFVGQFHVLPIGLSNEFIGNQLVNNFFTEKQDACKILKDREKFSHKGTHGHALLCVGSKGKMGAGILSARACLKSGAGLVTAHVPSGGLEIMQTAVPEVMVLPDTNGDILSGSQDIKAFDVIGVGPGIGQDEITVSFLKQLLNESISPMVIDADAINIIATNKKMLSLIPAKSILTPHPKEFERLVGSSSDNFDRYERQIKFSKEHDVIIVLKGAHTAISDTVGNVYFNSSGNNGMATAGSGDVLTGVITGLLAQPAYRTVGAYQPIEAAILGVYLHGFAGDLAVQDEVEETLIAGNIIEYLKKAFRYLRE